MSEEQQDSKAGESKPEAGTPKWALAIAALVPALALAWTVASHFLRQDDKPARDEPVKARQEEAAKPAGAPQDVTVSNTGSNTVVIGSMAGGSVSANFGGTAPAAAVSQSSSAPASGHP